MYEQFTGSITDIAGILAGHATDECGRTGCTAILCPEGAVGGVDVAGGAPGTRETDLFHPGNLVQKIHAVTLCGGSAYGLNACGGVMRYLDEQGVGLDVGVARVPLVCGAVIFDLGVGDPKARPDEAMGYAAAKAAASGPLAQGRVGAGTGATIGKILGPAGAAQGGFGTCSITLPGGAKVAAAVAVNALGDVFGADTGAIISGAKGSDGGFINTAKAALQFPVEGQAGRNTTIGVIATDAALSREQCNRLARVAQDGLALSIRPVHTLNDGDTLFALSTGRAAGDFNQICVAAVEVLRRAVLRAVTREK